MKLGVKVTPGVMEGTNIHGIKLEMICGDETDETFIPIGVADGPDNER